VSCKQCREIDRVQRQLPQIRLLKGAEVDILDDGTLDLDDATLQELDLVVISVHSKLTMDRKAMNRRVVRALRHPPKPVAECTLTFPHECRVSGGWRRQWHTRST
jgi:histidinol phosphatase-like PHP family hydrolase